MAREAARLAQPSRRNSVITTDMQRSGFVMPWPTPPGPPSERTMTGPQTHELVENAAGAVTSA